MKDLSNLRHASFFFIDIVGLSNPLLSTISQASKIKYLNECIANCKSFQSTPKNEKIVFPTGDGLWIAFLNDVEKPIQLAIEIHKKLNESKQDLTKNEQLEIRIGCHSGDFFFVNDLNGTVNLWGPGIIMARRLMDTGDSGHILMTSSMAENLIEISEEYEKIIHPLHDFKIKHGQVWLVYSVFGDSFGNAKKPKRGIITSKIENKISEEGSHANYQNLTILINLKNPKNNYVKITRNFNLKNKSYEPIYEIYDIIQTQIPQTFADMNLKCYDENAKNLELDGIHLDSEYKKEFSFKLTKPILLEEKNREYSISYETRLPNNFFEDFFHFDVENLFVKFIFPTNSTIQNPNLFLLAVIDRQKTNQEKLNVKRGITTQISWHKFTQIKKGDLLRMEW